MRQAAHRQDGLTLVTVLLIVILTLLLVGGGVGGYLYFSAGKADAEVAAKAEAEAAKPVAQYLPLEPDMVVNFDHEGRVRFLQVTLEAMTYDPEALEAVKAHMPVIRDRALLLLSSQTYDTLSSRDGKETLRVTLKDEINAVLGERSDKDARIEDIYFTHFVMQ